MTQRRIEEGVPPPGHIIDDTGRVRRVLGTLPLTADGCVAGIGAKVINPMGEEWLACVRSYAHEPGAEDDDPNCLLADCRAPLADSDAGGGGISKEQGMGQCGCGDYNGRWRIPGPDAQAHRVRGGQGEPTCGNHGDVR